MSSSTVSLQFDDSFSGFPNPLSRQHQQRHHNKTEKTRNPLILSVLNTSMKKDEAESPVSFSSVDSSIEDLEDERIEAEFMNYQSLHDSSPLKSINKKSDLSKLSNSRGLKSHKKKFSGDTLTSPQKSYNTSLPSTPLRSLTSSASRFYSPNISRSSLYDITNRSCNSSIRRKNSGLLTLDNSSILSIEKKRNVIINRLNMKDSKNPKNPYFYQYKENNQPKQQPPILPPSPPESNTYFNDFSSNDIIHNSYLIENPEIDDNENNETNDVDKSVDQDEFDFDSNANSRKYSVIDSFGAENALNFVDSRVVVQSRFNAGEKGLNLTNSDELNKRNSRNNSHGIILTSLNRHSNDSNYFRIFNDEAFNCENDDLPFQNQLNTSNANFNESKEITSNTNNSPERTENTSYNSNDHSQNTENYSHNNNGGNSNNNDDGNSRNNDKTANSDTSSGHNTSGSKTNTSSSFGADISTESEENDISTRIRTSQRFSTGLFTENKLNPSRNTINTILSNSNTTATTTSEINRNSIATVSTDNLRYDQFTNIEPILEDQIDQSGVESGYVTEKINYITSDEFNPVLTISNPNNTSTTGLKEINLNNSSMFSIPNSQREENDTKHNNKGSRTSKRKRPPPLSSTASLQQLQSIPSRDPSLANNISETLQATPYNSAAEQSSSANSTINLMSDEFKLPVPQESHNGVSNNRKLPTSLHSSHASDERLLLHSDNSSKESLIFSPVPPQTKSDATDSIDLEKGDYLYHEYNKTNLCPNWILFTLLLFSVLAPPFWLVIGLGYLDSTVGKIEKKWKVLCIALFSFFSIGAIVGIAVGFGYGLTHL